MTSRVSIYNPQGKKLTEIEADFYREWKISEYGAGKFDISVLDTKFSEENLDFGNWVYVEHSDLAGWVGTIETPREWNGGLVTVNCRSGEGRLKRALTRKDSNYHGTPGHVYSRLIEDACSEIIGLKIGDIYSSGKHVTMLDNFANVYDLVCKLADKRDEEWDVTPSVDVRGNLWFACNWYKKIGTRRITRLFEDIHIQSGGKMVEQGDMYNRVIVKGAKGSWSHGGIGTYTDEDAKADYGLAELLLSDNTATEEDDHIEYARNYVNEHKDPRKTFTLGIANINSIFKELRLGDVFTIETYQQGFTGARLGCTTDVRVLQMNYKDSENVVNIVADEVKPWEKTLLKGT